ASPNLCARAGTLRRHHGDVCGRQRRKVPRAGGRSGHPADAGQESAAADRGFGEEVRSADILGARGQPRHAPRPVEGGAQIPGRVGALQYRRRPHGAAQSRAGSGAAPRRDDSRLGQMGPGSRGPALGGSEQEDGGPMNDLSRRAFVGTAAGALAAAQNRTRPVNLVYVFADQLRRFSCGYAGDSFADTPNIDRLAKESLDVRQAIPSTPVCAPYRASLLTGKYQSSTGMVINELRLSPEHECIGHVLSRNGYDTAYIGKWHLWANQLGHHEETRNGFVPPGPYRLGFDQYWAAYNF